MKFTRFKYLINVSCFLLFAVNVLAQDNYSIEFFGGNDYINIGRPIDLSSIEDSGSFSVWFKSSQNEADGHYFISNDTQPTNPEFNFGLKEGYVIVNGGPLSSDGPEVISPIAFADSNWHHAVAIKESNCVSLYVDNMFIGQDCRSTGIMDTGDDYFIGDNRIEGLADYIGLLDEFRIYDRALSESEVSELFNCEGEGIPNLVAYYKFDEGSGTVCLDSTGSYNGEMNNMDPTNSWNNDVYCVNLSISEQSKYLTKLFPIPTKGIVYIESATQVTEINVYSCSGQLLY